MTLPARISRKSGRENANKRSPAHRAWIRGFACCACGSQVAIECAHVRRASNSGTGFKPSDAFTVSLCAPCHRSSHEGERSFEKAHGIDLMKLAEEFYRKSPFKAKLDDPYA